MASLTSSQSGNWTSSSTWGGSTPADGDTFTITAGHLVTLNSDERETNGYGDIICDGKLLIASGGRMKLNGRLTVRANSKTSYFTEGTSTSGGMFEMEDDTILEIAGDNAAQHSIWVENQKWVSIKCEGSAKNLNTTLSSEHDYNSSYLSVADATGFAQGDWITVFRRDVDYRVCTDEGFFVHDTDTANNRIYFKQFVSPEATISAVKGSVITVDNAKVFRVGYKIIFGTGSDRNVRTISAINKRLNEITLDSAPDGSVVGSVAYQTGNEKKQPSGSIVQRMATTVTTAITSANSTDQLVVGDAGDISVGDEIIVDVNNDVDYLHDYDTKYTVTAKSGNTLTLDDQLRYTHKAGSLVTIVTRDCVIRAADDSTDTRPFIYVESYTTNPQGFVRRVRFQNVHFKGLGRNTNSTYYGGFFVAGKTSYLNDSSSNDGTDYESRIDSCVYDSPNYRSSYTGFGLRDTYYFTFRNNVSYRNERGAFLWSGNYSMRFTNYYATRSWYTGWYSDGWYDPWARLEYVYITRTEDYAMVLNQFREKMTIRHLKFLNNQNRGLYSFYRMADGAVVERLEQDGYRYSPYIGASGGKMLFLDSKIQPNRWDGSAESGTGLVYGSYIEEPNSDDRGQYMRNGGHLGFAEFINWGFEEGTLAQMSPAGIRVWNNEEQCWDVQVGNDTNSGFFESAYIPANTKVRVSCELQCLSNYTGTRPYLVAVGNRGGYRMGRHETSSSETSILSSTTTSTEFAADLGFREQAQYSNASLGAFEEGQITIQAQPKDYILVAGVYNSDNSIIQEGYKMKDIRIILEQNTDMPISSFYAQRTNPIKVRSSFTPSKKRISGRI